MIDIKSAMCMSEAGPETHIGLRIGDQQMMIVTQRMIVEEIAHTVAQEYVRLHLQELLACLDQNAIANLAVAKAAKQIAQEIERSAKPSRVIEKTVNHHHHRSIF